MSAVTIRYFVAEGDQAEKLRLEAIAEAKKFNDHMQSIRDEFGAAGLWGREGCAPFALLYEGEGADQQKPGFLRPEKTWRDGNVETWIHKPDRRLKVGKAAAEKLASVKAFRFSDYVCKALKVETSVAGVHAAGRTGWALYQSVAGLYNGRILVKIPVGNNLCGGGRRDPDIPACLREIKHSEFIALTEEPLAEVTP